MASVLMSFQGVADQMYMDQFEKIQVYDLQLSLDSYVSPKKAGRGGRTAGIRGKIGSGLYHGCAVGA